MSDFARTFIDETIAILHRIDLAAIERMAVGLAAVRESGRLFILGVGGSAGHASHAVNDFRKICGFEAYAPTDNVSELTARINDEGWDTSLAGWLKASRLRAGDGLLIFSVGGGNREKNISVNLVRAIELAKHTGAKVFGHRRPGRWLHGAVSGRGRGHSATGRRIASRRTPRVCALSCGICWSAIQR